jgi:SAM-dependent methyltransferase
MRMAKASPTRPIDDSEGLPIEVRLQSNPILQKLFVKNKFVQCRGLLASCDSPRILDVGCGNHSAILAIANFPHARFVGVDRSLYNNSNRDLQLMESYFEEDLEKTNLDSIPDRAFDLVIASHVLEHLRRGTNLLPILARKVAVGGCIYIAFPVPASVDFPVRGQKHRVGTLNFYDDPTHITVLQAEEIQRIVRECGLEVVSVGVTRTIRGLLFMWPRILLSFAGGGVNGAALWDLYGFEEVVVGRLTRAPERDNSASPASISTLVPEPSPSDAGASR